MKLTITERPINGFLSGPKSKSFSVFYKDTTYEINIEQFGGCKITIISSESGTYDNTLDIYYSLKTLLMLFDGQFYSVVSVFDSDIEITQSWQKHALASYYSADFMVGVGNALIDFETVMDEQLFSKWYKLKEELNLIHQMVLYCLSSVEMPKDIQCAFMVEAFEGLAELIEQRYPEIMFRKAKKGESQLQINLLTFITHFGAAIFEKEMLCNPDKFTQRLVDSRNRIAHIKSKQNRVYLDGGESIIYLMKLSLLYRVILFDLLGIDGNLYKDRLMLRVRTINDHDVVRNFLRKLGHS